MLVMVAPIYAVARVAGGVAGGVRTRLFQRRSGGGEGTTMELELERRLDRLIQVRCRWGCLAWGSWLWTACSWGLGRVLAGHERFMTRVLPGILLLSPLQLFQQLMCWFLPPCVCP